MKNKLKKQMYAMGIIILALALSINSGVPVLQRGAEVIMSYIDTNYTSDDIKQTLSASADFATEVPAKLASVVNSVKDGPEFGNPIDPGYVAGVTDIYAAYGGDVTAVGENEEIGKYVKITHGSLGESLYGNLEKVFVAVPARVKKGQKIGTFEQKEDEEFYYSFTEFN